MFCERTMDADDKPPIVDVLDHYSLDEGQHFSVSGHEKGWYTVHCPFHGDSQASGRVNYDKGVFKCHGCDAKGDSISLIQQAEGLDFHGAIAWAQDHLGYENRRVSQAAPAKERYRPSWSGDGG